MTVDEELMFIEVALKRELVTQEQVDEIHALKGRLKEMGLNEHVADLMVKKGMLSESDAVALKASVSQGGGPQRIEGYRLVERLGRGGMGSVYKAVQISMDRLVALKVLKPSLTRDDQQVARLRREAQLVGKLKHPNIVRGLDFGVSNGFHYFAMEYVEGESVKEAIEKNGPFKEKDALRIVKEITLALEHAHEEGIVHRDVKPGNILLGKDGTVRLADYGLAKGPLEDQQLTASGVTVGTPQYISPEQARGPSDVDIRTDIYSLGATLYHMVTGRPPYEGETLAHLIEQVLYEPYAPPRTLKRSLSPNICFLIEKMLARKPRHRYQNPRELLADLAKVERGESIVPAGWEGDFEAFHLRQRFRRALVATVVVLLLGGGASLFLNWRLEKARRQQIEVTAQEELEALLRIEVTKTNLEELIRRFDDLAKTFAETDAARVAHRGAKDLRRRSGLLQAERDRETEARDLAAKQEWAAALRTLREFAEQFPEGESEIARDEAYAAIESFARRRDEEVARRVGANLEDLLAREADPGRARDALRRQVRELSLTAFLPDEEQKPLARVRATLDLLDSALTGVEKHLAGPRAILDASPPRDYREFEQRLSAAKRAAETDAALKTAIAGLPAPWANGIAESFDLLADRGLSLNRAEADALLTKARDLSAGNQYSDAVGLLRELSARSLPGIADNLASEQQRLAGLLDGARARMEEAWKQFLPEFLSHVGARRWPAAEADLAKLRAALAVVVPNDFAPQIRAAEDAFAIAQGIEQSFLENINGRAVLPEGLRFDRVGFRPMYDVTVQGRNISFRREQGLKPDVRSVETVSLDDLRRECGMDAAEPGCRMLFALFRVGELRTQQDDRTLYNAFPDLESEILAGKGHTSLGPLAEEATALLRSERMAMVERLGTDETAARIKYDQALKHIEARRWQDAYDLLNLLLTDPRLSRTDYVKQIEPRLRQERDDVKAKLPSGRLRDFFGARSDHLAGVSVNSGYRASLLFDWEEPAEIERFVRTPSRVAVAEVTSLFIGPDPPAEGDAPATRKEHVLRFLPPVKTPDDWLDRHPLRLESPFAYSEEVLVEFRARWEAPVALVLSVCGVNVAILSDADRRENGRGVHIWQSADASRPDLVVPDELRSTWLARHPEALAGDSARRRYFGFEPARWYRVRFVKGPKEAALYVDGRLVHSERVQQYVERSGEISIRTWTPCDLDELLLEGTVDREWFTRNFR